MKPIKSILGGSVKEPKPPKVPDRAAAAAEDARRNEAQRIEDGRRFAAANPLQTGPSGVASGTEFTGKKKLGAGF